MDPDADLGGSKTYGFYGSGSATLLGKLLVRDGNTACLQEGLGAGVEPALLTQDIRQSTCCNIK
jgi:hypothetical protein